MTSEPYTSRQRNQALAVATAFFALFSIVGFAYYGLPFFYDFFVQGAGLDPRPSHVRQRLREAGGRPAVRASSPGSSSIASGRGG